MKQNLGITDRVLRFALAFWWLDPFVPNYDIELINWVLFIVGWIALLESFTAYCWLHDLFGIHTKDQ